MPEHSFSIEQDKYGTLWLGTSNGLIKYDGRAFQNVSWESGYQTDIYRGQIFNLLSDTRGLLWIVARGGLNIYYPDNERFFKVTPDTVNMLYKNQRNDQGMIERCKEFFFISILHYI